MAPTLPMIVDPPTCPAGFSLTTTTPAYCEPWPLGEGRCADANDIRLPGDASCRPVAPCPAGDFAEGLPAEGVIYVLAGASGDGSLGAPFGTIGEALGVVPSAGIIAIGAGEYQEVMTVTTGVSLIGACPERTTLMSSVLSSSRGVVNVAATGVVLRGLTITAPLRRGIRVLAMASLRLEGVVVRDVYHYGIKVDGGANLETDGVIVANVVSPMGDFGAGLRLQDGTATLRNTLIEDVSGTGILADGAGGTLTADGLVVRGIVDDVGLGAGAVHVQNSQDVTLVRSVIESNQTLFAVACIGEAVAIDLESSLIRAGSTPAGRDASGGAQVRGGASLSIEGTTVRDFDNVGIWAGGAGGALEIADSLVDSIAPAPGAGDPVGIGVNIEDAAGLDMQRTRVSGVTGIGIRIDGGSVVSLEDAVASDVAEVLGLVNTGRGIQIGGAARATLSRVLVEAVEEVGLYVANPGTRADGSDIVVRRSNDRGISLEFEASADFTRVTVDEAVETGVACLAEAALTLNDATIRRTRAAADGFFGRGVSVQLATADFTRVHVDDYDDVGIFSAGDGTTLNLTDIFVENGVGLPRNGGFGDGIFVQGGAAVRGARVAVERAREVGVLAINGGIVELSQFHISRITDGVEYEDNGINLDSTSLPVPTSADAVGD